MRVNTYCVAEYYDFEHKRPLEQIHEDSTYLTVM